MPAGASPQAGLHRHSRALARNRTPYPYAHSPDEKVQISSVQRFYEHVKALLKALA